MAIEAFLAFGGNLGDPVAAFATALRSLKQHPAIALKRLSSVYRTPPWGKHDQPEFLNMAVLVKTGLSPRELLALCLDLERAGGRERRERWGPRTLDIDILTSGDEVIDEPDLQVPHPRIAERAFVLVPLAEIAPELTIGGVAVKELLAAARVDDVTVEYGQTARLRTKIL